MWFPIFVVANIDEMHNMISPELGILPMNYCYPGWATTRKGNHEYYDEQRWISVINDHVRTADCVNPPPDRLAPVDDTSNNEWLRHFRPYAPFYLDMEHTYHLQQEGQRADGMRIIKVLREQLALLMGSMGHRITYSTLQTSFTNVLRRPHAPYYKESLKRLHEKMYRLAHAAGDEARFWNRAFQDELDFWSPWVFRLDGLQNSGQAHVIKDTVAFCRQRAPKPIYLSWHPHTFATGNILSSDQINHDLDAIYESGADGIMILGNHTEPTDFDTSTPEWALIREFAMRVNG